ncbi:flagellar biosynthetic protein FliR [bacterium]|nr:flagellar biosynthetic protein FliR [bacterium]
MGELSSYLLDFQIFILVVVRMSSFIVTCPVLSSTLIPARAKVILSLLLSFTIFPIINTVDFKLVTTLFAFVQLIGMEIFAGMVLGFVGTIVFEAIRVAGEVAGMQGGFGIVSVMDPQHQQQISIISIFLFLLTTLLFIATGGLIHLMEVIVKSYKVIKIGGASIFPFASIQIASFFTEMIKEAIKLVLPITAIVLTINCVMGLLSRAVPKIQVFLMAFPLNLIFSMTMFLVIMPLYFDMIKGLFDKVYLSFDYFYVMLGA